MSWSGGIAELGRCRVILGMMAAYRVGGYLHGPLFRSVGHRDPSRGVAERATSICGKAAIGLVDVKPVFDAVQDNFSHRGALEIGTGFCLSLSGFRGRHCSRGRIAKKSDQSGISAMCYI
jgi:hypothetical protein